MKNKGLLLVLSGPSGCGKGTVCRRLLEKHPDMRLSVSATTREKRAGEQEGVDYFYKTREAFEAMIARGELLEYNRGYNGNYYGTPKQYVREQLEQGHDVILEIEMNGAARIKEQCPDGVFIFLAPPSLEELHRRLIQRGRETAEQAAERFSKAKAEIGMASDYRYVIVNDELERAVERIEAVLQAERCLVSRNEELINELIR